MSKEIDVYAVVKKLVGPIEAQGSTHLDETIFENVKKLTALVDEIMTDLDWEEHRNKKRIEHSRKEIGRYIEKWRTKMLREWS